jgi:uncharacterized protein (TIGR02466 family)
MGKAKVKAPDYGSVTAFPTKIITRDWDVPELNRELKLAIWRARALDPVGLYRSNTAGTWHSKVDILATTGDVGLELHRMFGEAFTAYATHAYKCDASKYEINVRIQAWAMVYEDRGYAAVHNHPNCHASAVYYVDNTVPSKEITMATGVTLRSGDIEFLDTRVNGMMHVEGLKMSPSCIIGYETGRMITFPSSLPHYVHPVNGPGERISIAANANYILKERTIESNE